MIIDPESLALKAAISVSTGCLKKLRALIGDARIDFFTTEKGTREKGRQGGQEAHTSRRDNFSMKSH